MSKIYKKMEYKQFVKLVTGKNLGRAILYAKALGIDRRTLNKWFQEPELQAALAQTLDTALDEMQKAGKHDWRMWRELLKLAGLEDEQKVDVTSLGERIEASPIIISEIKARVVESNEEQKPTGIKA